MTDIQVEAVRKMYEGPHTRAGVALNRGLTRGSESSWGRLWNLVKPDPTRSGSWLGVYRYMVFDDPHWDPVSLDFDVDPATAKRKLGPLLEPDSDDLSEFSRRGGKLLVYHAQAGLAAGKFCIRRKRRPFRCMPIGMRSSPCSAGLNKASRQLD